MAWEQWRVHRKSTRIQEFAKGAKRLWRIAGAVHEQYARARRPLELKRLRPPDNPISAAWPCVILTFDTADIPRAPGDDAACDDQERGERRHSNGTDGSGRAASAAQPP